MTAPAEAQASKDPELDTQILAQRKAPHGSFRRGFLNLLVSATYGRLFTQLSTSFFTWSFAVP